MFSISRLSIIALCSIILTSCVTDGVGRYRVQSIGNAQRSVAALVLSANPVIIAQQTSGSGANAGGALGGAMALDNSDSATALIAGIIAGAVVGDLLEANGKTYDGTEYVIESEAGLLLTVAQVNSGEEVFSKGDRVILVYGYPHRLIKDPR
ncbi:hypothetical protein [Neptunomonas qingdaonensis]|uniref:Outer membrane lipoprotein SlyB n=1 Tax=Neptunomonas qingdaonensis TaxID=1045558 RepID=A0A1I2M326_9GAMM|nr:hypothetical protein [Neptunomonas qingdaonensis]SFF83691.1 outer membrane lipoprotein SlyB [Neptunomonas qingdaonensis]